ncbi:MAG: hypothetical protein AAGC81_09815 [Pseudomonadota bacterium]
MITQPLRLSEQFREDFFQSLFFREHGVEKLALIFGGHIRIFSQKFCARTNYSKGGKETVLKQALHLRVRNTRFRINHAPQSAGVD